MPVSLIDNRRGGYYSPEEAEQAYYDRRKQTLNENLQSISRLGQAFQNYYTNRQDQNLMKEIFGQESFQQPNFQQPNITIPSDPGGGVQFLDPNTLARQNMMNRVSMQPSRMSQPNSSMLSRLGQGVTRGMPLSPLQKAMAEARIKQMFEDQSERQLRQAQGDYYRSRASFYNTPPEDEQGQGSIRDQYNALRQSGYSSEEARKQLGI